MKKKDLTKWIILVIIAYIISISIGILVFFNYPTAIEEYISIIPFLVAIPAALLTRGFQRRASYIKALRNVWPKIVESGRLAIEYTYIKAPTEQQFRDVVISLSSSIDHLRMLFKNVGGFYPVESIKMIYEEFDAIRSTFKFDNPEGARNRISALWHQARDSILEEFDRVIPDKYDAPEYS